ncbi:MAG: hypothetical protein JJK56_08905 [Pseudomonas sp.]|uniref:Uncharacterized protein n=1 Tax=Pseudomonas zeae TaxID=2745510 RepID=A0A9E6NRP3_9PSED|nr:MULTISPECIES: hypothetical protein [Pseudomonas]MBL7228093.1 hypothetical protein [Pseudomonas sp.]QXI12587.1 hypothetical protein HU754_004010 [Pseudomonas zeae]
MDAYQRRRRIQFWLGSFPVLVGFTILVLALILAGRVSPKGPQELDGASLSQQAKYSPKITNQKTATILAVSQ